MGREGRGGVVGIGGGRVREIKEEKNMFSRRRRELRRVNLGAKAFGET